MALAKSFFFIEVQMHKPPGIIRDELLVPSENSRLASCRNQNGSFISLKAKGINPKR